MSPTKLFWSHGLPEQPVCVPFVLQHSLILTTSDLLLFVASMRQGIVTNAAWTGSQSSEISRYWMGLLYWAWTWKWVETSLKSRWHPLCIHCLWCFGSLFCQTNVCQSLMVPSILLKWMEISLVKMTPLMPYALSLMFWWQYLKLCQIDVCQSWWYLTTPPSFPLLRSDCDCLLWWQGCSKLKIEPTAVQQVGVRSTVDVLHSVWWEPELVERDWIVAPSPSKPCKEHLNLAYYRSNIQAWSS